MFRIRILVADHSGQTYFTLVESSAPYFVNKSATKLKKETDELTDEQVQNFTLAEISKLLVDNYSSLHNFDCMPIPDESIIADVGNMLILEETSYNLDEMCAEHSKLYPLLTGDQRTVYDKIMYAVDKGVGGVFFLYGYGGTGKTFIWRTLCSALRGRGDIVFPVASSGIASLLLPNGRTAHSRFGIPLLVDEKSYCNKIKLGTEMTELLKKTKLIIWDEAPMTHRYVGSSPYDADEIKKFDDWILHIGDGVVGNEIEGEARVSLSYDILIRGADDPISVIVEKAILAPTNDIVEKINDHVMSKMSGEVVEYLSSDSICNTERDMADNEDVFSPEFLNTIKCSGLPNHVIRLKVGCLVMLLRNIDQARGLCNGTRMVVTKLGKQVIEASPISGKEKGQNVLICSMIMSPSDFTKFPIRFQRRQFPPSV
ncbi:hypothetical protein OROMI_028275 [Orobanche minor]